MQEISKTLITEHLPAGYVAPYGFDLATFTPVTEICWTVNAYDEHGTLVDYAITVLPEVGPDSARAVSAPSEPLQHPYRKDYGGVAPVADWIDAIALADAAGRRANAQGGWADDTLEGVLSRVEDNIVAYGDRELATTDAEALRRWLDEALAATQVRVECAALVDFPLLPGNRLRDGMLLHLYEDDEITGWLPIAVTTDYRPDAWLTRVAESPGGARVLPRPTVAVRTSGAVRTWLHADHVTSWTPLMDNATVHTDLTDAEWIILHVVGTEVALVFPLAHAHVRVQTDSDGALVTISAGASAICEAGHRRRAEFEREWGGWLDPSVSLPDEELRAGIARAVALFREAEELEIRKEAAS